MGKLGPRVGKQREFTAGEWQGPDSTRPRVGFAVGGPKRPRTAEGMKCGRMAVPLKAGHQLYPQDSYLAVLGHFSCLIREARIKTAVLGLP